MEEDYIIYVLISAILLPKVADELYQKNIIPANDIMDVRTIDATLNLTDKLIQAAKLKLGVKSE